MEVHQAFVSQNATSKEKAVNEQRRALGSSIIQIPCQVWSVDNELDSLTTTTCIKEGMHHS